MALYKIYKGKKVEKPDPNYDKGIYVAQGMIDGERYHKALKTAKTKKDAKEQEDLIIAKLREANSLILRIIQNFLNLSMKFIYLIAGLQYQLWAKRSRVQIFEEILCPHFSQINKTK